VREPKNQERGRWEEIPAPSSICDNLYQRGASTHITTISKERRRKRAEGAGGVQFMSLRAWHSMLFSPAGSGEKEKIIS